METYSTRQNKVSRLIRILKYLYTLKQLNSRELLLTTKYHRNQDAKAICCFRRVGRNYPCFLFRKYSHGILYRLALSIQARINSTVNVIAVEYAAPIAPKSGISIKFSVILVEAETRVKTAMKYVFFM